jgi:pectinesterase
MNKVFFVFYFLILLTSCHVSKWTVDANGHGKYTSIQSALDAVPEGNKKRIVIKIKPGTYVEVVTVDARKGFITLKGSGFENTIITYNNHAGSNLPNGDTANTWTSASVFVYADDFKAEGIRFNNSAGFKAGQAVALRVEGSRAAFFNCAMTGNQDVLFLSGNGTKQYFKNCYISGTTDFIFGGATAVFDSCHIRSKKNSHVTAASTNSIIPFGFVFRDCLLTADSGITKVSLGRPWSPTASVTYLNCTMDNHIIPEGWNNWKNPANELTARFAEYHSDGEGANPSQRVKWSKQLTDEEANKYTLKNILGNWDPLTD